MMACFISAGPSRWTPSWSVLSFVTHIFSKMSLYCSFETASFPHPHTFVYYTGLPNLPKSKLPSLSTKTSPALWSFGHHSFPEPPWLLQWHPIPFIKDRSHLLSSCTLARSLVLLYPFHWWETQCESKRLGSLYKSKLSWLFNDPMFWHALSLHQDYSHAVFKDLIVLSRTLLIWYSRINLS